jgi:hypothetical protein
MQIKKMIERTALYGQHHDVPDGMDVTLCRRVLLEAHLRLMTGLHRNGERDYNRFCDPAEILDLAAVFLGGRE